MLLILLIYYYFNPAEHGWFAQCAFYRMTGLECPSCGSQRALHLLLHGEPVAALASNPFLVISIPYVVVIAYGCLWTSERAKAVKRIALGRTAVYTYLILFGLWWIIRNIV